MNTKSIILLALLLLALLLLALLTACRSDDGNAPPIESASAADGGETASTGPEPETDTLTAGDEGTMTSIGTTASTSTSTTASTSATSATGADTSTGEPDPCDNMGKYVCHGWQAGLYRNNGIGAYQFQVNEVDQVACIDDDTEGMGIQIVGPYMGQDPDAQTNEMLAMLCQTQCNEWYADGNLTQWPATHPGGATWQFSGDNACVFGENGFAGYMPANYVSAGIPTVNTGVAGPCDSIAPNGTNPPALLAVYIGPPQPDECVAAADCGPWNPAGNITHTYNATKKLHTTWIDDVWLRDVALEDYMLMYSCDEGYFSTDTWTIKNTIPLGNELLFTMGLRDSDKEFRIKRSGTSTWYNLNSFPNMADAFDALYPIPAGTYLVVEFKRLLVGGSYVTHTMNLTIN